MFKGILSLWASRLSAKPLKTALWILVIFLLGIGSHYIMRANCPPVASTAVIYQGRHLIVPEHSALRSVITIAAVKPQTVVSTLTLPATVQVIPANLVEVFPPLTGQIDGLFKKIGDHVQKGEPLYTVTSPDLAQAIADRSSAEAVFQSAQKNLQRQRDLAKFNIGAMHEMEEAESSYTQANARLQFTLARLAALHVTNEKDTQGQLLVRSPIDGEVTAVNAGFGSYWSDLTSAVMEVADLSRVYIMAFAREREIPAIYMGQEGEVIFDADGRSYPAKVTLMNPMMDADTRTVALGLVLDNPELQMKPNMFAQVKLQRKPRDLILLPMTAVIQRGFDSLVFVEVAPWTFESRIVVVGPQIGDHIEIKSGLAQNERVALTGGIILND